MTTRGKTGRTPASSGRLVEYWRRDYDWRLHERAINALPHFHVDLDGTRLHFLHIRGRGRDPKPLLLCHGWPSSFLEYRKISPMLTEDAHVDPGAAMSFDLVIPSLPGYGFSDPPTAPGVHPGLIARRYDRLMTDVLGYERYAAHGSDIGANVVSWIGLDAPDHVVGIHVTTVAGSAIVRDLSDRSRPLSDRERAFLDESARWTELEGGYAHLQRTRPRTISYALNDSPAGLAAWIVEKFRAWSDCGGDVTRRFTLDELLTTIMVYWSSGAIGPSMRLYYEGRLHPRRLAPGERVEVPCGVALFPHDSRVRRVSGGSAPIESRDGQKCRAVATSRLTRSPSCSRPTSARSSRRSWRDRTLAARHVRGPSGLRLSVAHCTRSTIAPFRSREH